RRLAGPHRLRRPGGVPPLRAVAGGAVLAMLQGWIQIIVFAAVLFAIVPLLGGYMARVFTSERVFLTPVVGPLERLVYRILRVDTERSQGWKSYAGSLLVFSGLFWLALYLILRTQTLHPFNPDGFHSGTWDLTFNT